MQTLALRRLTHQTRHMGERHHAPATARQKVTAATILAAMLTGWAIYFAGWKLFGGYEKQVALAAQFVAMVYVIRWLEISKRS
jgi:hypothetical protein